MQFDQFENNKPAPEDGPPAQPKPKPLIRKSTYIGALYLLCLVAGLAAILFKQVSIPQLSGGNKGKSFIPMLQKESIAIVRLDGVISRGQSSTIFGDTMVDRTKKNLEKLIKRKDVKAVILEINSPGGTVASCQEIVAHITKLKAKYKKPIIALLADVAASGGYYVASACDSIVSSSGTITGSIGVIFQTGDFESLLKRFGIKFNIVKSGKFKDIGSPTRAMKEEERQLLQTIIDTAYEQFVAAVAMGRGLPAKRVRELADGRIYIGEQAYYAKLVDSTNGYDGAIEIAKKKGGIHGEPKIISDTNIKEDIFSALFEQRGSVSRFVERLDVNSPGLFYLWPGSMH
ncbi:signal peptide peptidase SppA [Elusimicrobiota bacterium]